MAVLKIPPMAPSNGQRPSKMQSPNSNGRFEWAISLRYARWAQKRTNPIIYPGLKSRPFEPLMRPFYTSRLVFHRHWHGKLPFFPIYQLNSTNSRGEKKRRDSFEGPPPKETRSRTAQAPWSPTRTHRSSTKDSHAQTNVTGA